MTTKLTSPPTGRISVWKQAVHRHQRLDFRHHRDYQPREVAGHELVRGRPPTGTGNKLRIAPFCLPGSGHPREWPGTQKTAQPRQAKTVIKTIKRAQVAPAEAAVSSSTTQPIVPTARLDGIASRASSKRLVKKCPTPQGRDRSPTHRHDSLHIAFSNHPVIPHNQNRGTPRFLIFFFFF